MFTQRDLQGRCWSCDTATVGDIVERQWLRLPSSDRASLAATAWILVHAGPPPIAWSPLKPPQYHPYHRASASLM